MGNVIDLYEFFRDNRCSEAQIARVLPALFIHLYTEKLPRIIEPNDLQMVPLFSISSLGILAEMNPLSRTIMDGVRNFWAHLWIWLKSFCIRINNPSDLPPIVRFMARGSVVRLLAALAAEQDLVSCLCSTTGFLSALYELWVLEITDTNFEHEANGKPLIYPTVTALQPCMSFWSFQPCINWMDEVIIPMGGTADICGFGRADTRSQQCLPNVIGRLLQSQSRTRYHTAPHSTPLPPATKRHAFSTINTTRDENPGYIYLSTFPPHVAFFVGVMHQCMFLVSA